MTLSNMNSRPKIMGLSLMVRTARQAVCLLLVVLSVSGWTSLSHADFGDGEQTPTDFDLRLNQYLTNPESIQTEADILQLMRQYHIVLVPGYLSDLIPQLNNFRDEKVQYFKHNTEVLSELGIDHSIVQTSSFETIRRSGDRLFLKLKELRATGVNKPFILVGHSRGGPVVVSALLHHPQLTQEQWVERGITLQSPVHGNRSMTAATEIISRLIYGPVGYFGLGALRPGAIARDVGVHNFEALPPDMQNKISRRVRWFVTEKPTKLDDLRPTLRSALVVDGKPVPSDHYVALENQRAEYGHVLAYSQNLNHIETVLPTKTKSSQTTESSQNHERSKLTRAFTLAFLHTLYEDLMSTDSEIAERSAKIISQLPVELPPRIAPEATDSTLTNHCLEILKIYLR